MQFTRQRQSARSSHEDPGTLPQHFLGCCHDLVVRRGREPQGQLTWGNVEAIARTTYLFAALLESVRDDTDGWHAYLPGWEMPKLRPEQFTRSFHRTSDIPAG